MIDEDNEIEEIEDDKEIEDWYRIIKLQNYKYVNIYIWNLNNF